MATYKQIQAYVRTREGFVPKTSWIADVKEVHGLTRRSAHNRRASDRRVHPCPFDRRAPIEAALRHFGMLAQPEESARGDH